MTFAGVLFLIAAFFNAVAGIVAIVDSGKLYVGEDEVVIESYRAFGVVLLALSGIEFLVGWGIIARLRAAQIVGIIMAILAMIVYFAYFVAHPAWSAIMIVLSGVIIYALTVYNAEFVAERR